MPSLASEQNCKMRLFSVNHRFITIHPAKAGWIWIELKICLKKSISHRLESGSINAWMSNTSTPKWPIRQLQITIPLTLVHVGLHYFQSDQNPENEGEGEKKCPQRNQIFGIYLITICRGLQIGFLWLSHRETLHHHGASQSRRPSSIL